LGLGLVLIAFFMYCRSFGGPLDRERAL
jgi:hypothetical protein